MLNSNLEWQVVGMAHGSHLDTGWGRAACFRLTGAFGALTRELAHSLRWGSLKVPPASSMDSVIPNQAPTYPGWGPGSLASVPTSQRCPGLIGRSTFLWMLRGALCPHFWGPLSAPAALLRSLQVADAVGAPRRRRKCLPSEARVWRDREGTSGAWETCSK